MNALSPALPMSIDQFEITETLSTLFPEDEVSCTSELFSFPTVTLGDNLFKIYDEGAAITVDPDGEVLRRWRLTGACGAKTSHLRVGDLHNEIGRFDAWEEAVAAVAILRPQMAA